MTTLEPSRILCCGNCGHTLRMILPSETHCRRCGKPLVGVMMAEEEQAAKLLQPVTKAKVSCAFTGRKYLSEIIMASVFVIKIILEASRHHWDFVLWLFLGLYLLLGVVLWHHRATK